MCNEYSPMVAPFYSELTRDEHDKSANVALLEGTRTQSGEVEQKRQSKGVAGGAKAVVRATYLPAEYQVHTCW